MASPSKSSNPGFTMSRTKSKKKPFVQQKVEVFRASDPVLSVFMWGINHTVNDLCHVPVPVMLLPDDFKANRRVKVSNHLFNKENLPGNFKFKEYCPQVFRNLRERFGLEDLDYQASLTRGCPIKDSDSQEDKLLLTSSDSSLTVKQLFSEEVEEIHNILPEYHQHIVTCHGITLLPQFLAMYRVTVNNEDTYFIVMRNMFSHRLTIHRKYDLKVKELSTFKDMDFRNKMQQIYISDEDKEKLITQLNRDVEFLVHLKIMDYSLLLGIHDVERAEQEEQVEYVDPPCNEEEEPKNCVSTDPISALPEGIVGHEGVRKLSYAGMLQPRVPPTCSTHVLHPCVDTYAIRSAAGAPQRELYIMGLKDILTYYDTKMKAAKTVKHGSGAEISTVHPEQYGKRFLEFITNIIAN